jgi:Outer membrane protein and related peptidoglycan-associated (lipo)proteins
MLSTVILPETLLRHSYSIPSMTFFKRLTGLLILLFLSSACSSSDNGPAVTASNFMPAELLKGAAYSPSAMEALSRGLAVITPPGAALQDVYYEFDSIDLKADAEAILKKNAEWMKANPLARVEVEGHCDDVGSAEYNLALGAKRAQTARDFLVQQGIAPDRLVTISYGKEAPACLEQNEDCRVKNRRARFVMFTELPTS